MSVAVGTDPSFSVDGPQVMFDIAVFYLDDRWRSFDVARDGRRFLMVKRSGQVGDLRAEPRIHIVQNWHQELLDRVPVN